MNMKKLLIWAIVCSLLQSCQKKMGLLTRHQKILSIKLMDSAQYHTVFGLPIYCEKDYITFPIHLRDTSRVLFCNYQMVCSPLKNDVFHFKLMGTNTSITGQFKVSKMATPSYKQLIDILTYEIHTVETYAHYVPIRSGIWHIQTPSLDTVITYNPKFVMRQEMKND
jgi:hypothetical protein